MIDQKGAEEIASRSRGTPRIANRLLRRARDYAQVRANGEITKKVALDAMQLMDVDKNGFDLKYTHPNLLFISWLGKTNPKEYKNIEYKTKEYKPIEEYKPKGNFVYNTNLLKTLDNNIKIMKQ